MDTALKSLAVLAAETAVVVVVSVVATHLAVKMVDAFESSL